MKIFKMNMLIKACLILTFLNISFTFLSFKFFLNTILITITTFLFYKLLIRYKNIKSKNNKFNHIKTPKTNNFLYYPFKNNQSLESHNMSNLSYPAESDYFTSKTDISNRFANLLFDPKQLPKNFISYN